MRLNVKLLICLFITLPIGQIKAQKIWTLEECIGYSVKNNISIKRQLLQTEISQNNLTQSKFDLAPSLNGSANHTWGWGYSFNNNYQQVSKSSDGNIGLNSSITVFSGLQKINTIKMNKYDFLSSVQNLEKIKNEISLNIASGYLQILYTKELRDVAQSQLEVTQMQVDKTNKLFEVGNVAKGALLEIQATEATEQANITDAENNLNLAYLNLAQMLDLDTIKNFKIFIPDEMNVPETFSDNPDSIYKIAIENMPEIKSAEFSLLKSKSQLSIAKGARFPELVLKGGYGTYYDYFLPRHILFDQLDQNRNKNLSLSLNIPIFSKYSIQKNIKNARIGVQDSEFQLRQSQLQLRKEIEQAYFNALASFQNFKSRTKLVAASEENFRYVQQKFDVGLVNSVDYSVDKKNFAKAKSDLLYAKYDFIFKTKVLEFYKGNSIKL